MLHALSTPFLLLFLLFITPGCAEEERGPFCVPGTSQECACEGVFQTCKADGSGFESCDCESGLPSPADEDATPEDVPEGSDADTSSGSDADAEGLGEADTESPPEEDSAEGGPGDTQDSREEDRTEGDGTTPPLPTIWQTLSNDPSLSYLQSVLSDYALEPTLDEENAAHTLFAVPEEVFLAFDFDGIDEEQKADLFRYHIVANSLTIEELSLLPVVNAINEKPIRIVEVNGDLTLNGLARFTVTDIPCSNGTIHLIDTILVPPKTVLETILADAQFSDFASLLSSPLDGILTYAMLWAEGEAVTDAYTVFVPVNSAFEKAGVFELISSIPVPYLVEYHMLSGNFSLEELASNGTSMTVADEVVTITKTNAAYMVNGEAQILQEIFCTNGTIYAVDSVLEPPTPSCYGKPNSCESGSNCFFNSDLTNLVCIPDGQAGDFCQAPGFGECASNYICTESGDGTTKFCAEKKQLFDSCGEGEVCEDSLFCAFEPGIESTCIPKYGIGYPCPSTYCKDGVCTENICEEGSSCQPVGPDLSVCVQNQPEGNPCGPGVGGCADDLLCIPDDPSLAAATCQGTGSVGEPCGGYGQPQLCQSGSLCAYESQTNPQAICLATQGLGEVCGVTSEGEVLGICGSTLGCIFADPGETTTACVKKGFVGAPCGSGVGACADEYNVVCAPVDADGTAFACAIGYSEGSPCQIGSIAWCAPGLECTNIDPVSWTGVCMQPGGL